jgi:hypothetical protein
MILIFALWVVQLVLYAVVTCLIQEFPDSAQFMGQTFVLSELFISQLDLVDILGGPGLIKQCGGSVRTTRLLMLFFVALHHTYLSFLFPLLASTSAVITTAVTSIIASAARLNGVLRGIDPTHWRGPYSAQDMIAKLSSHIIGTVASTTSPILFASLLTFNRWSYNAGMFHVLSDLSDSALEQAYIGIGINVLASWGSLLTSCLLVRHWYGKHEHQWLATEAAGSAEDQLAIQRTSYSAREQGHSKVDLTKATVVQIMREIAREIDRIVNVECQLVCMTLASVNTVVGVCMLMKHDGMNLIGWWRYCGGAAAPHELHPIWT